MKIQDSELIGIISKAVADLKVSKAQIFREAGLHSTNLTKWKTSSPTERTKNKIIEAIKRISKLKESNDVSHKETRGSVNP